MDVVDSDRYREAVDRLRRLLYDPPPWDAPPTLHSDHALHSTHHTYNASHYTAVSGGDIEGVRVGMGLGSAPSRWLLEMLRHQEDLIAQLEKENEFLKREVVSIGEGVKSMTQENTELNRRLTEALNQAINTGEGSDASSYNLEEMDEAIQRQMTALSRERALLQEEVRRLEGNLAAVTKREQDALAKLNHALALAQDTHAHTAKVRASSESALEEVTNLLTVTQQEGKELKRQLADAEERLKKQEGSSEEREAQQQQRLQRLEDDRDDLEQLVSQLKQQVRDGGRKIGDLEEDLQIAKAARLRLEAQLEEQRQHSKDAHNRLDQIILARTSEAAAGAARARDLEERLSVARQDSNRLLLTITSMAQGTGRTTDLDTTDDVKSERRAAEQQLSATLAALQTKHEDEVMKLREAADQQSEAMKSLKEEVERMRQQLAEDNEKYRVCLDEVGRGLAALSTSSPDQKTQPVKGASDAGGKSLRVSNDPDSGLPSANSAVDSGKKVTDTSRAIADEEKEVEKEPEGMDTAERPEATSKEEKDKAEQSDKGEELAKVTKEGSGDTKDGNGDTEDGNGDTKDGNGDTKDGNGDTKDGNGDTKDGHGDTKEDGNGDAKEVTDDAKGGDDDKKGEDDTEDGNNEAKGGEDDKKDDDAEEETDNAKGGDDDTKDGDGDANDGDDAKGGNNDPDEDGGDARGNDDDQKEGSDEGKGEPDDDTRGSADGTEGEPESKGKEKDIGADGENEEGDSDVRQEEPREDKDCERCENWMMIMESLEEALQGLQLDINKQATRLDRLSARERAQCDNCVLQHLFLGAVYNRLDNVDKYSHMLDDRIQSLSHRLLSC
ncbi:golgin subfamily A member 6-like protein 2 [Penaeus japonicus]|uniref:golgin subfamily A member 6-like protein 2 n=1 Tax=Penaeus japonicus TaxID=27405 RepID=UPI001C710FC1|nr:golgin subfamily A member 6-like protein 2 [Penaeus japonicus]